MFMQKDNKSVEYKHKNLVGACAKNDRNAQMEIYNLYYKAMYNTSLHIVNDSFLAEDIMQEAFLDAFGKLKSFEWRSSFGTWLKRIVIYKSIDALKRNLSIVPLNEEMNDFPEENINQDFEAIQCKLDEIKLALKQLSPKYKIVLVLHLIEGYDHHEISQILNLSYNNVRVRYIRAKSKLLEEIVKSRN